MIQGSNGKLYGTTTNGGIFNRGSLYEYDIALDQITILHSFNVATDGSNPDYTLVEGNNVTLYGVTIGNGPGNRGTLFSYNISTNTFTVEVAFGNEVGEFPLSALVKDGSGLLYGSILDLDVNDEGGGAYYVFDPPPAR